MRSLSWNFRFDLPLRPKADGFVSGQSWEGNLRLGAILFRTPTQVNAQGLLREVPAVEEELLMSALSESHVERYTEHNTKPDPLRHLVSCRTDGCTYTDTHRNP